MGKKTAHPRPMTEAEILALPYRPCVGIVLRNPDGLVFAGQRADSPVPAWQMPQGGIDAGERPEEAALRELGEETGLSPGSVRVVAETSGWLRYDLPHDVVPRIWKGRYRGQEQRWFLMDFLGDDAEIALDRHQAEFTRWTWIAPTDLVARIVPFKQETYRAVFAEFAPEFGG